MAQPPVKIPNFIRKIEKPDWTTAAILLYGRAGVGKTYTAAGGPVERRLLIDIEDGCKGFAGDVAEVRTLEQLAQLTTYLGTMDHPYYTVVLDGLDALYELTRTALGTRGDTRRTHIEPTERMVAALRKFVALPLLTIVTAHSRSEVDEAGLKHVNLALPPAFREKTEGMFDVVGHCRMAGTGDRRLVCEHQIAKAGTIYGKDRTGRFGSKELPLSWATLSKGLGLV